MLSMRGRNKWGDESSDWLHEKIINSGRLGFQASYAIGISICFLWISPECWELPKNFRIVLGIYWGSYFTSHESGQWILISWWAYPISKWEFTKANRAKQAEEMPFTRWSAAELKCSQKVPAIKSLLNAKWLMLRQPKWLGLCNRFGLAEAALYRRYMVWGSEKIRGKSDDCGSVPHGRFPYKEVGDNVWENK